MMTQKRPQPGRSAKSTPNPASQTRKKKNRNRPRPKNQRSQAAHYALQPCTRRYLAALTDPFKLFETGHQVCVPDTTIVPSYKFKTRGRGTFTVGTAGAGFVFISPCRFGNDQLYFGSYSDSTYAGVSKIDSTATGSRDFANSRFPFTMAQGSQYEFRLVGAGLRVRYTGTELSRGGQLFSDCRSLTPGTAWKPDFQNLLDSPTCSVFPVDRNWRTATWSPVTPDETQYRPGNNALSNYASMMFCATGSPGNTYEFEYTSFFELIPLTGTLPSETPSESDVIGLSSVMSFMGTVLKSDVGKTAYTFGLEYATNAALLALGHGSLASYGIPRLEL